MSDKTARELIDVLKEIRDALNRLQTPWWVTPQPYVPPVVLPYPVAPYFGDPIHPGPTCTGTTTKTPPSP